MADETTPGLWHNRSYRLLLTGKVAETVGGGIGSFAVPLVAFHVTGNVVQAGVIAAVGQAGSVLTALPAGVVVDRVDRRRIIMAAALVAGVAWAGLVVVGLSGGLTAVHLAAVLFVSSTAGALLDPADTAALHAVVRKDEMGQAMAVAQGRDAVAGLVAGPVGGLLYGMGHVVPFLVAAVGRLIACGTAALVREPLNGDLGAARAQHPVRALREGLRYVWGVPVFRVLLTLFTLVNVLLNGAMVAITLDLVRTGTAPVLIGLVNTAVGVGVVLGALLAGRLVRTVRVGVLNVLALGVVLAAMAVMAALHTYWGYLGALLVMMMFAPALNAGMVAYQVAITPAQMQGRAASVLGLTGLLATVVSPLLGGLALGAVGIAGALWWFTGAFAVVTVAIAAVRPIWRIGLPDTWAADVAAVR
ncbi:MFS transporter [Myceligenerans salitolerans]|uniref:MFS transporter n=1 Tax=Myceligenerans salitolerans TaxID=1230528 RepID=A0ABS3ICI9_9MICO|nr:MFS transporter [Myceligenerans salitolerans]MBO0610747.1 MFS transporter [Myceligenerans salitolerans]